MQWICRNMHQYAKILCIIDDYSCIKYARIMHKICIKYANKMP
jgi:hypothetical protein